MPMGCGRGIHDGGFRLYPGSDHCATHGTGGKTDTRMAAYPFDLPSIREGIDIQDALLFSKPDGGLDGRPIPFETLQVEISLTHKGREVVGSTWQCLHAGRRGNVCLYHCTRNAETLRAVYGCWRPLWQRESTQKLSSIS